MEAHQFEPKAMAVLVPPDWTGELPRASSRIASNADENLLAGGPVRHGISVARWMSETLP
jgi:hypothetical protein